jgi:hypothetical protein
MEDPGIGIRGYFQWIADETPALREFQWHVVIAIGRRG